MSKEVQVAKQPSPQKLQAKSAAPATLSADPGLPDASFTAAVGPAGPAAIQPGPELDELEHRAWRAFLFKHARLSRILEADLLARSNLPLAEFDVLFQLALCENHRLRMNELADRVLLSRAGVTRLVDRLVVDGLVGRLKCDSDGRGAYAVLTDVGRARLEEARPAHLAAVKRHFLGSLTRTELGTLADLLEREVPPV
jgi:DNA-binding MarR family transcriptional regulator